MSSLRALLAPASIAIIGASADFRKVNGRPFKHLVDKGYAGRIFPVNPKYDVLEGIKCYPDVASIGAPVDLAIVAVPAKQVARIMRDLAACKTRAVIVFSSGFAEVGGEGTALEAEVRAIARETGMRLCGPNCLGLVNAFEHVIATFGQYADGATPAGPVGFVTQSGAFGTAIAALARRRELGLGYFVNTGNEADVTFAQVMQEVIADPRIKVGAGYIEGLRDGAELNALARAALDAGKPLVLTKVGRSSAGARAAASHTGSLAGADVVFDAVIRQHCILRARNEEHMLDIVEGFAYCGLPQGRGLGVITQSGGAGVLMADRAEELGLTVPVLNAETQKKLAATIPGFGACGNPVDVTGQFVAEPALLRESVKIVLADPQVHIGIVWLQLMDAYVDTLITIFEEIKAQVTKPFLVCWVAASDKALRELRARGIAVMRGAEPAVDAAAALVQYSLGRQALLAGRPAQDALEYPSIELLQTTGTISSVEAAKILQTCGIKLAQFNLATSEDSAVECATAIGFPVALKIESPDIAHKTEAGGVKLNLKTADEVRAAYAQIVANVRRHAPAARISGVIVQAMARDGLEMVVGLHRDAVHGTIVMAGVGGIHVEVLKDVAFRAVPITPAEAAALLDELKSSRMLDGVRGAPPVNRAALAELISRVSLFGAAAGERFAELDLNPVRVNAQEAVAVDWLMVCR